MFSINTFNNTRSAQIFLLEFVIKSLLLTLTASLGVSRNIKLIIFLFPWYKYDATLRHLCYFSIGI